MGESDQCKNHLVIPERRATVCEQGVLGMCGEIFRYRKCRPVSLKEHLRPGMEVSGNKHI